MWVATPSSQWTFTTYSLPVSRRTHFRSGLLSPCLRFAEPVTGHHARLGSRLPAKLYRGRHFRRHGFVRFQGATRSVSGRSRRRTARPLSVAGVAGFRDLCRVTPSRRHPPIDTFLSKLCRRSRLTHRREGRRDQQLVCLPDRAHPSLRRPRPAGPAGFLADAGALTQILVHPGVDELVEPAELARPARRQG